MCVIARTDELHFKIQFLAIQDNTVPDQRNSLRYRASDLILQGLAVMAVRSLVLTDIRVAVYDLASVFLVDA
ncbi:MAG: hypothetical protein AB7T49_18030 [Oligoflexales bacterium]